MGLPERVGTMDDVRNFGVLLKDAARLYTKYFERHTGEIGMTLPKAKVLGFLRRNEGTTQAKLAEISETEPMTLVRILDHMEQDGWIERRADADDRRVYRLYIRPPALPVLDQINDLAARARGVALAGLPVAEHRRLVALLEHVHRNLTAADQPVAAAATRSKTVAGPRGEARSAGRKGHSS